MKPLTLSLGAGLVLAVALLTVPCPARAAELEAASTNETNKATDWRASTRVTMKCQDAAPEEVLDELAKAGDIALEAGNTTVWSSTGTITLDVKDRPFWPVFIDACRQARVDFQTYINDRSPRRIQLMPGMENHLASMPMYEAGGCLLIFQSASRTHSIQYGSSSRGGVRYVGGRGMGGGPIIQAGPPNQPSVTFTLQALVMVDPKLRLAEAMRTTLTVAEDENGTSLLRPSYDPNGQVFYNGQSRGFFLQTSFNLYYPTNAGRQLAKLEGNLRIPTVLKEETWEIADVLNAKPETKELNGRSITIRSVGKSQGGGANYEVRLTQVVSPDSEAPGLRRVPSELYQLAQSMTLIASDGTQLDHGGGGGGGNEAQVSFYSPNKDAVPSKLIWKVPTEIREIVVPFAVTNLSIP